MPRILIVDDDPKTTELLTAVLEAKGHAVEAAANGREALTRLGVGSDAKVALPDLIILDLVMPELDGFTVASRLNANQRTRSVPVIILTGKGAQMSHFFKDHPNVKVFLEKPVNLVELVESATALTKRAAP